MRSFLSKKDLQTFLLICLSFFWTGCAYLTWVYHLRTFYPASATDLLSEVCGYLFQAAGLLIVVLNKSLFRNKLLFWRSFTLVTIVGLVLSCLTRLAYAGSITLIFGFSMNLVFGMIAGLYLIILALNGSPARIGIIFGAAYGIGSILSYILSLPGEGSFLSNPIILLIYTCIGLSVLITAHLLSDLSEDSSAVLPQKCLDHVFFVCAVTVILLSCVNSAGAYFPISSIDSSHISLELSRAFYAVGLIAAGLINDKKRSIGAILCVAALCFPFFSVAVGLNTGVAELLRILGYIFFGFYSVYRVLLFLDLAQNRNVIRLVPLGLLFGRIGDSIGSLLGSTVSSRPVLLVSVIAILFGLCIFLLFYLYQIIYMPPAATRQDRLHAFAAEHGLSARETQIMDMVLNGNTNKEIAEHLIISENTVKFHMRNLLKKTSCANRAALISMFSQNSNH